MTHDLDDALDVAIDAIMYAISNNNLSDQTHRRIESAFNEIRLIRKAALKMAADGGWQPIETCPKEFNEWYLVKQPGTSEPITFVATFECDLWYVCNGKDSDLPLRGPAPTHWMPLPQPPKESEK